MGDHPTRRWTRHSGSPGRLDPIRRPFLLGGIPLRITPEIVRRTELYLARALGAPQNYLSKTLRRLAQRGLLRSVRGPKGGFELLVEPARLSTSSVLAAVDESVASSPTCLLGDRPCDPDDPCEVHGRWIAFVEQVLRPMKETSMADLLGGDIEAAPDTNPRPNSLSR